MQRQGEEIQLLREQNALQSEQIHRLKDEIAVLKGEKGRPNIKPSGLNKEVGVDSGDAGNHRKRGKPSCKKTTQLKIHHERVVQPKSLPPGSKFKGYQSFVVQDIETDQEGDREPLR